MTGNYLLNNIVLVVVLAIAANLLTPIVAKIARNNGKEYGSIWFEWITKLEMERQKYFQHLAENDLLLIVIASRATSLMLRATSCAIIFIYLNHLDDITKFKN